MLTLFMIISIFVYLSYFKFLIKKFFESKSSLIQLPLYLFGVFWGVFYGGFYGLEPIAPALVDLFNGDPNNLWGLAPQRNFFATFVISLFLVHLHGFIITPLAILATFEYVYNLYDLKNYDPYDLKDVA